MLDQRLTEIATRWNKVEERLKEVEHVSRLVRTPSINELRYAGRQIVDALLKLDQDASADISRQVIAAAQYVQNADHDVTDALLDFMHNRLDTAYMTYGEVNIIKHFPHAARMRERIDEAEALNKVSRGKRETRDASYEHVWQTYIVELLVHYNQYRAAEPKFAYEQRLLEKRYILSYRMNVFLGLCTFFGLVYSVLSYYGITWTTSKTWFQGLG